MARRKGLTPEEITRIFGYVYVDQFFEGFAKAFDGRTWFHVRKDGQPLYPEKYDQVGHFNKRGRAVVQKGGERFFINRCGTKLPIPVTPSI